MYVGVTLMSSEKSTRTWNGNVCDPVSKTTWSARDERLWRCHCSLRRFSSMTCITKWSHVRATKKNSRLLSLKSALLSLKAQRLKMKTETKSMSATARTL
jgi:hypothetical protein